MSLTQMEKELSTGAAGAELVSAVIPCYRQAKFLSEAVESVLAQTYTPFEIIVVDDGSPDNVSGVLQRYPGVKSIRQENRGLSAARNAGFRACSGNYVVFLDADDRLTPSAFEAHLRCFAQHPESGFVVGDIDHITLDGSHADSPRWPLLEADQYEELLRANHLANTIAVMFRRNVLERLGGFDPFCSPAEDYELLLRAARLFPSAHHRTVVAQYRRYPLTLSRQGRTMLRAMQRVMRKQLTILDGNPRLMAAWRQGDRYWREHFGRTTIKEIYASFRCGELTAGMRSIGTLLWHVRTLLLILPWKYRKRIMRVLADQSVDGRRRALRRAVEPPRP